jgi:hypothetical protein
MKRHAVLSQLLIPIVALVIAVQAPMARAEMISTHDAIAAQDPAAQDRAKVQAFLDRASVKDRLQTMGVSSLVTQDRVDALSNEEVHNLAQRIDALPAGGALGSTDIIIILLVAILIIVAV